MKPLTSYPLHPTPHTPHPTLHTLHFQVQDTGSGIAPEELDRLFQTFSQTETGRKSQQGSGLGLAISKQFVQLMGGEISVDSVVDKGTTFQFSIPITLSSPVTLHTTRHVKGLAPNQPTYRILIVENSWESRQLMLKLLSLPGLEVREAVDGREAIEQWQIWQPHLIWMDMQMPVMDGFEATRQIREHEMYYREMLLGSQQLAVVAGQSRDGHSSFGNNAEPTNGNNAEPTTDNGQRTTDNGQRTNDQGQQTVIIALTASAFEADRLRSLDAGCDDFVRKPFSEGLLFEKMREHLGMQLVYDTSSYNILSEATESEQVTESTPSLDVSECLQAMPQEWVHELNLAATRLDTESALQLLMQIPPAYAPLGNTLTEWINNFRFDSVIELLSSS